MHRRLQYILAVTGVLSVAPVGQPAAAEMPGLPQLIEMLQPPGERRADTFSTTAINSPRARPAVDEVAARTTAPEGTAAAALALPFPSGSATLTPEAEKMLDALARALNAPELVSYRFRIEGHTDTSGEAPVNLALSERRATTVREHLVSRLGVAPSRLAAAGLSETQLLVQTPDATAEPRNRRVQIVNVGR